MFLYCSAKNSQLILKDLIVCLNLHKKLPYITNYEALYYKISCICFNLELLKHLLLVMIHLMEDNFHLHQVSCIGKCLLLLHTALNTAQNPSMIQLLKIHMLETRKKQYSVTLPTSYSRKTFVPVTTSSPLATNFLQWKRIESRESKL